MKIDTSKLFWPSKHVRKKKPKMVESKLEPIFLMDDQLEYVMGDVGPLSKEETSLLSCLYANTQKAMGATGNALVRVPRSSSRIFQKVVVCLVSAGHFMPGKGPMKEVADYLTEMPKEARLKAAAIAVFDDYDQIIEVMERENIDTPFKATFPMPRS